jgi:hypothetical protein
VIGKEGLDLVKQFGTQVMRACEMCMTTTALRPRAAGCRAEATHTLKPRVAAAEDPHMIQKCGRMRSIQGCSQLSRLGAPERNLADLGQTARLSTKTEAEP